MRHSGRIGAFARHVPALLIPFVPKCPLCLLPLFAAAGVALPPRPVLDGLVAVAAAVWLAIVISTARWLPVRAAALAAAILLVGGRLLAAPWASAIGAVLLLAVVFWTRRKPRACEAAARATATRDDAPLSARGLERISLTRQPNGAPR